MKPLGPDGQVFLQWGWFTLNATIVFTWVVMALLIGAALLITRNVRLGAESPAGHAMEVVITFVQEQIAEVAPGESRALLPLIMTLFLFVATSNALAVVPFFQAPTASLSTTSSLGLFVFISVPYYGLRKLGLLGYLRGYIQPNVLMLPFNLLGELSRTLALSVRLFGNVMSGSLAAAILLSLAPLLLPVVMQLFGLLTGLVQAYVFAVLALIYIASGMQAASLDAEESSIAGSRP